MPKIEIKNNYIIQIIEKKSKVLNLSQAKIWNKLKMKQCY
jgi:hypothetical protein